MLNIIYLQVAFPHSFTKLPLSSDDIRRLADCQPDDTIRKGSTNFVISG